MPLITIFTPTFNRSHLLANLYQSLRKQKRKNFEWIVINDGSTDNTEALIQEFISEQNEFAIVYKVQPNGGKHRAINNGVKTANGDLFFIVDSDDYLTDNATELIEQWYLSLDNTKKWAGISGLKGFSKTELVGKKPTQDFVDAKNNERKLFCLEGDKAEVYLTNVLKQYPFPEIPGEKFITEEVVWDAIARDGFYLRWFNEIIYICDYLSDGLTQNLLMHEQKSPQGVLYWRKIELEAHPEDIQIWKETTAHYYDIRKGFVSFAKIASELKMSVFKLFFTLLFIKFRII